jgi:ribonuclease P protein component
VNEQAVRVTSVNFVVLAAPRRDPGESPRLGITVTRRVGNAVVRNGVKRRVREAFRHQRSALRRPLDVVVIARRGAVNLATVQVESELAALFQSCSR